MADDQLPNQQVLFYPCTDETRTPQIAMILRHARIKNVEFDNEDVVTINEQMTERGELCPIVRLTPDEVSKLIIVASQTVRKSKERYGE